MVHDGLPDDYHTTVDDFIETLDGSPFNSAYEENPDVLICDFCSQGIQISSEPRVAQYYADRACTDTLPKAQEINAKQRLAPLATYCEDCSHRLLFYPCEGYTELRVMATVAPSDKVETYAAIQGPEIRDVSPRDDGIPWEPRELSERLTGHDFDQHTKQSGKVMAPENIIVFFLAITDAMDIREIINPDGSIDPKGLGRARRKFQGMQETLREEGYDRVTFRDHIQD